MFWFFGGGGGLFLLVYVCLFYQFLFPNKEMTKLWYYCLHWSKSVCGFFCLGGMPNGSMNGAYPPDQYKSVFVAVCSESDTYQECSSELSQTLLHQTWCPPPRPSSPGNSTPFSPDMASTKDFMFSVTWLGSNVTSSSSECLCRPCPGADFPACIAAGCLGTFPEAFAIISSSSSGVISIHLSPAKEIISPQKYISISEKTYFQNYGF